MVIIYIYRPFRNTSLPGFVLLFTRVRLFTLAIQIICLPKQTTSGESFVA